MALMYKDLNVTKDSNLEVFITCLVWGWEEENNEFNGLNNPSLQILYDDVLVFSIDSAIRNQTINRGYTMNGWNQFRLFSR